MLLQYWHDSEIPSDVADAMASWPGRNPGITHQVLSREAARQVLAEQGDADVLACFDEARHPAMQSDIIRLAMLARVGGLYVDADERCTAPVTPLLRALAEVDFIGWLSPETPPYVFNGFMAVRPGCPVILDALRDLTSLRAAHRKAGIASNIWEVSGPGLITRAVGRFVSEASHAERVMLLTDREWRRFAYTDETLAYKHAAGGNWRLT
jgi:mannosyltransferase OCH1-like enzyme